MAINFNNADDKSNKSNQSADADNLNENLNSFVGDDDEYEDDGYHSRYSRRNDYKQPRDEKDNPYANMGSSMASFLRRSVDVNNTSEQIQIILKRFAELKEQKQFHVDINLLELDSTKNELPFSALIAIHKVPSSQPNAVAMVSYSVLLVENERPAQYTVLSDTTGLELPVVAFDSYSDYYDAVVQREVQTHIRGEYGQDTDMYYSGVSVLYKEIDLKDDYTVVNIIAALSDQCVSEILERTLDPSEGPSANFRSMLIDNNYVLETQLQYKSTKILSNDYLPVGSDILIATKWLRDPSIAKQMNIGQTTGSNGLIEASCIVDFIKPGGLVPPKRNRRQRRKYDEYEPELIGNIILTNLDSREAYPTLTTVLLGLSTALIAQSEDVYPEALKPRTLNNYEELGNFGSLGMCVSDPEEPDEMVGLIDLHSERFSANEYSEFYKLLFEMVSPELVMSIDIPRSILGSRAVKTLRNALIGDVHAAQRIEETLDILTDGIFTGRYWDPREDDMTTDAPIRVPLGYFVDRFGNKRDIREITLMTVAEWAGNNEALTDLDNWIYSYEVKDQEIGCAIRLSIMERMFGRDNIVVKEYAERFKIPPDFVNALAEATVDAKVAPLIKNLSDSDKRRIYKSRDAYSRFQNKTGNVSRYTDANRFSNRSNRGYRRKSRDSRYI